MKLNGTPRPRTFLRRVGWFDPEAPSGRRISEDHGWQPPDTVAVYVIEELK